MHSRRASFGSTYKVLQSVIPKLCKHVLPTHSCHAGFRPLYKVLQRDMNSKETLFAGLAGLRGSVSLILAQAVVTEDEGGDSESQVSCHQPDVGFLHEDLLNDLSLKSF